MPGSRALILLLGDSITQLSFSAGNAGWGAHLADQYQRRADGESYLSRSHHYFVSLTLHSHHPRLLNLSPQQGKVWIQYRLVQ